MGMSSTVVEADPSDTVNFGNCSTATPRPLASGMCTRISSGAQ